MKIHQKQRAFLIMKKIGGEQYATLEIQNMESTLNSHSEKLNIKEIWNLV